MNSGLDGLPDGRRGRRRRQSLSAAGILRQRTMKGPPQSSESGEEGGGEREGGERERERESIEQEEEEDIFLEGNFSVGFRESCCGS